MEEKKKYVKPEATIYVLPDIDTITESLNDAGTAGWDDGTGENY